MIPEDLEIDEEYADLCRVILFFSESAVAVLETLVKIKELQEGTKASDNEHFD